MTRTRSSSRPSTPTVFQVEIGERLRTISVVCHGDDFLVAIDGREHLVDARRVTSDTLSLLVRGGEAAGGPVSLDASVIAGREPGAFEVHLDGYQVPLVIRSGNGPGRRRGGAAAQASGPQRVVAPMPGKVVRVLVTPGDAVKARQGLVVVEAMKMENELKAARDGHVREVAVTEGQSVDAGAVLAVVE